MGARGKKIFAAGVVFFVISTLAFAKGRKPPTLHFILDPATVTAGRTLSVRMVSDESFEKAYLVFEDRRADFYPIGVNEWRALMGFNSLEDPGAKIAELTVEMSKRHIHHSTIAFVVEAGTYPVGHVKLSKQKDALVSKMNEDAKTLDAVYRAPRETQKLWDGLFIQPSTGIISSYYGSRRAYGARKFTQPHTGTDIANQTGTPVIAPNRGRVAFAGWLDSFGNAVMLDHGQGVFSYYLHMEQALVKEGDSVEKGTLLGLMGAEGVATGPHVHWSFVVAGERVDPLEWTRREFR